MKTTKKHRVFISHSSAQKRFVEELRKEIGCDLACIDKYTFESGKEIWEEIMKHIKSCEVFVFLISKEAIDSDWVNHELTFVRELVFDEGLTFMPFIIDCEISLYDESIKKWVRDKFITNTIISPKDVARNIIKAVRDIVWEQHPALRNKSNIFIGRTKELGELQEKYYNNFNEKAKSLIISGLPQIGRKRLIQKFLIEPLGLADNFDDIISINLRQSSGINDLMYQLNAISDDYSTSKILEISTDHKETLKTTIELINKLYNKRVHFVITDDYESIVKRTGHIIEWFIDILKSKDLLNGLTLNVATRYKLKPQTQANFPNIVFYHLQPMKDEELKILFKAYSEQIGLETNERLESDFIDKIAGYPGKIIDIANIIKEQGPYLAKKEIERVIKQFDANLQSIIDELRSETPNAYQVLLLLSKFEFINYEMLEKIYAKDASNEISRLFDYSLIQAFGKGLRYIGVNQIVSDYLHRHKEKLDKNISKRLKEATTEALGNADDELYDLSFRLYTVKEAIKEQGGKLNSQYLIPSFVLKAIIEEYNDNHNENVIALADRLLNTRNKELYAYIESNVRYWLCCSLCRLKDQRALREAEFFEDGYTYNFIHGFYYRNILNYRKAKEYYEKALASGWGSSLEDDYGRKAKHELVLVMTNLDDYEGAFSLAKENYEDSPDNTYHIEMYFKCLVKSKNPDTSILLSLLSAIEKLLRRRNEALILSLKAEYEYFINMDYDKAINIIRNTVNHESDERKYVLPSLKSICKHHNTMDVYRNIKLAIYPNKDYTIDSYY